jgi:hypothetical protein
MSAKDVAYFFWSDWLGDPAVRRLSPAERGVWIDLLALAAVGSPTGYVCDDKGRPLTLKEIARVTNAASPDEVAEHIVGILEKGTASRDRTGRLFNGRMVRRADISAKRRVAGAKGGAHAKLIWKDFQSVSRQAPGHLPQRLPHARDGPLSKHNKTSLQSPAVARARASAGAPTDGRAPAERQEGNRGKRPDQMSRAELEAAFAARKSGASESASVPRPVMPTKAGTQ